MKNRNCIVFDLDYSICNSTYCPHLYNEETKLKNYRKSIIDNIKPNYAIKCIYHALEEIYPSNERFIISHRPESFRENAELWLSKNTFKYKKLYMKRNDDNRSYSEVKKDFLSSITEKYNILFLFDTKKSSLSTWEKIIFGES